MNGIPRVIKITVAIFVAIAVGRYLGFLGILGVGVGFAALWAIVRGSRGMSESGDPKTHPVHAKAREEQRSIENSAKRVKGMSTDEFTDMVLSEIPELRSDDDGDGAGV